MGNLETLLSETEPYAIKETECFEINGGKAIVARMEAYNEYSLSHQQGERAVYIDISWNPEFTNVHMYELTIYTRKAKHPKSFHRMASAVVNTPDNWEEFDAMAIEAACQLRENYFKSYMADLKAPIEELIISNIMLTPPYLN